MNDQDFIAIVAPIAIKLWLEGSSIFPSVRIAQAMHETGIQIHPWFNLVGYKAGKGKPTPFWDGRTVNEHTWEEVNGVDIGVFANWRVYKSIEDCFRDQDLLLEWSNYDNVRAAPTPELQCYSFIQSPLHYATDSNYPAGLLRFMKNDALTKYDQEAVSNMKEIEDLQAKVTELEAKLADVPIPDWFEKEFKGIDLTKYVNDPSGDKNFWRNTAISLRMTLHK